MLRLNEVGAQATEGLYQFPKSVPQRYVVDARGDYERMAAEPYKKFKKRDVERFAEMTAYGKQHIMNNGGVYYDPPLVEAYLGQVLSRIAPEAAKPLYLARDASYNAFTIHDGSMFMHVGMLADLPNEAALAAIMGHELAHYLNDDNRSSFFKKLKLYNRSNRNDNYELRIDKAHEDRVKEHVADSMGILMARKAGYDLRWTLSTYLLFLDPHMDEDTASTKEGTSGVVAEQGASAALLNDHPGARERIDFLTDWLAKDKAMLGGAENIVDAATFAQVRHMARMEALQVLLEGHHYYACIERGFRYHLSEPGEPAFLYFLAEGLRRYLYIMPDQGIRPFLADGYEDHLGKRKGILNDLALLMRDSALLSTVDTAGYYRNGRPVFDSNDEALAFFLDKGDRAGILELQLSRAIQYRKNTVVRDSCLKRYVEGGGRAKSFAEAFRNNQLERKLRKNKGSLLLLDEIDFIEDHTYGYRTRYVLGEERQPKYDGAVRSVLAKNFPGRTVVSVADLKREDLPGYLAYSRVSGNLAIVQWMWDYERDRAVKREKERGRKPRAGKHPVEATQHNTDSSDPADSLDVEVAVPDTSVADPDPWKRRKRTKQDMKFYFIDPMYWEFLVEKGYATVDYMKVRAFDDKTRIAGNVLGGIFFLYPGYWAGRVAGGSNRYAFELQHMKFNANTQQVRVRYTSTGYKMDRAPLKSVIYESMIQIDQ